MDTLTFGIGTEVTGTTVTGERRLSAFGRKAVCRGFRCVGEAVGDGVTDFHS